MDLNQDHAEIAWGNWTAQFADSPRLQALVQALLQPANGLQGALRQLYDNRWLDSAYGAQLDGIGQIVGFGRLVDEVLYVKFFGFSSQPDTTGFNEARMRREHESPVAGSTTLLDEEYRKLLYWKIALNNGHGTSPEIAATMKAIFDASQVIVQDRGNAKLGIWMNTTPRSNPALLVDPLRWIPKLAGVGVELIGNTFSKPFGFINQGFYGFGEGVMARSIE